MIYSFSIFNLSFILIPVIFVSIISYLWKVEGQNIPYAFLRMISQLLLIGYLLTFFFASNNLLLILSILTFMIIAASWISMRPIRKTHQKWSLHAFISLVLGSLPVLILVIGGVIQPEPWFEPRILIPIAGMIFAHSMTSISLAAERFLSEIKSHPYSESRNIAFQASLIPILNSFFAVGLVSLPGMMTGQILSGVSPLIAVRYQIMVMCMLLGASGLSCALFLSLIKEK